MLAGRRRVTVALLVSLAALTGAVVSVTGPGAIPPASAGVGHLGAAAGVNLPLLAYRDLLGIPTAPAPPARIGLRWISFADDLRAFLRARDPSLPAWIASLRGPKVHDVFAWDDAWPLVASAARHLRARAGARP